MSSPQVDYTSSFEADYSSSLEADYTSSFEVDPNAPIRAISAMAIARSSATTGCRLGVPARAASASRSRCDSAKKVSRRTRARSSRIMGCVDVMAPKYAWPEATSRGISPIFPRSCTGFSSPPPQPTVVAIDSPHVHPRRRPQRTQQASCEPSWQVREASREPSGQCHNLGSPMRRNPLPLGEGRVRASSWIQTQPYTPLIKPSPSGRGQGEGELMDTNAALTP